MNYGDYLRAKERNELCRHGVLPSICRFCAEGSGMLTYKIGEVADTTAKLSEDTIDRMLASVRAAECTVCNKLFCTCSKESKVKEASLTIVDDIDLRRNCKHELTVTSHEVSKPDRSLVEYETVRIWLQCRHCSMLFRGDAKEFF
jgi:hypothetical protein